MIPLHISEKVITVGPDPAGKGGIASVVQYYRDELFPHWNFIAEARAAGGKISKLYDFISACLQLRKLLENHQEIQIVHLHTAGKISFPRSCAFMRLAKSIGREVVMHMHSGTFPSYCAGKEKKVSKALNQADAVIVLGERWAKYYEENFGLKNIHIVPNIVPDVKVQPDISKRASSEILHALFLGQLSETKGIYDLLESLALCRERLQGRFVLHVGGKGDTKRFSAEVHRLGLEEVVIFEGWISSKKKADLLARTSMSILPSYFEGLPVSLLEGMACGHALIATNVGSIPEIIDDSNGVMLEPGDKEALSEAIAGYVEDREKLIRDGAASKAKVMPYLPDNVGATLTELYKKLICIEDQINK